MDLSTITVADFKAQFRRGFAYLSSYEYDVAVTYNSGDRVYYTVNGLFYDCVVDGTVGIDPTDTNNWTKADDDIENYIQDEDIQAAFVEAQLTLNQQLFSSDANITLGYLYLTAHYLVNDIRAGDSGVGGAAYMPVSSRSVGSVSESYSIPQAYLDNPIYSFYTQSPYGLKYLNMVLPYLVGNVGAVCGATRP